MDWRRKTRQETHPQTVTPRHYKSFRLLDYNPAANWSSADRVNKALIPTVMCNRTSYVNYNPSWSYFTLCFIVLTSMSLCVSCTWRKLCLCTREYSYTHWGHRTTLPLFSSFICLYLYHFFCSSYSNSSSSWSFSAGLFWLDICIEYIVLE